MLGTICTPAYLAEQARALGKTHKLKVTVLERAGAASGSTGHNQAQLHSGARYAVNDPESARECIQENLILRQILPEQLELNDGLFLAVDTLREFCRTNQAAGRKVKIYYTIRELTTHLPELWALRSLGDEVLAGGPGGGSAANVPAATPTTQPAALGGAQ